MEKSIIFIGFMGVGKTTIGKLVAEKLGRKFIDTDVEIEKEYKMPISQIFEKMGEKAFRDREKSLITTLCNEKNLVLSLGGGAFLQEEIRKECLSSSMVIYLDLSFENWLKRLDLIFHSRPVLQGKSIEEMKELYVKRKEIYSNHHLKINTDHKDVEAISEEIVKKIGKIILLKNVTIGDGIPKICVSMVGRSEKELIEEAKYLKSLDPDIIEWRVDFYEDVEDIEQVKSILTHLREILFDKPLIFTFRSKKEGGEKEISTAYYLDLNVAIVKSKKIDIIDIELFNREQDIKKLVEEAHSNGVIVIISNHDFEKTPPKEEIISRLLKARDLGADLPKIAVMPNNPGDVLTLLDATNTMRETYDHIPIITISMGDQGIISRVSGGVFGSAVTFGAAGNASAPGQIPIKELEKFLDLINSNIK